MPVIKVSGGFKIRRSTGGLYPKVYRTRTAANRRVGQMHSHKRGK